MSLHCSVPELLVRAQEARKEGRLGDARSHLTDAVAIARLNGDEAALAEILLLLGEVGRDVTARS